MTRENVEVIYRPGTSVGKTENYASVGLLRFGLEDAQRASTGWGANCGPGAIAAIMGMTLDEVRPYLGDFERKRYTSPTLMREVLDRIGRGYFFNKPPLTWPQYGLARIQWHGPWMTPGVPIGARERHTHWVASCRSGRRGIGIFDINAMSSGGWISLRDWGETLVPWLLKEAVPRADGQWSITHAIEVSRA
jgi:hypothetical protein